MWKITKEFDFCYAHRVWNQELIKEYSIDNQCACRHLHGHQGSILVTVESDELKSGMVTDFKNLTWFKKFIDDNLDHKFIIDGSDPMISHIVTNPLNPFLHSGDIVEVFHPEEFMTYDVKSNLGVIKELAESFIIVKFVPTSENLSKWLFNIVDTKMKQINVKTTSVQFFETPKSNSLYIGQYV